MHPVAKHPSEKNTEQPSLEDCLLLLLRGIQENPVVADESRGREFREKLAALESTFKGKQNARQVTEAAVGILAQYNKEITESFARQRSGLVHAASDLAAAAKGLALESRPADRLSSLEQQINALSPADDLARIKSGMIAEVALARAEALEEHKKIGDLLSGTITQLAALPETAAGGAHAATHVPMRDTLTGLPTRAYAEGELIRAYQEAGDCYLAIFVVKRLALINAKFGFARGDQVLLKVVAHLAQSLPDFPTFFRWTPCSFLTVAPAGLAFRELRAKVQVIELTRMTPTLEWQGHNAMVPVAIDCRVISVKDFASISELFLRLDTLASDA